MNRDNHCPHCKKTDCNGYSCQQEKRSSEEKVIRCENCCCRLNDGNISAENSAKCKKCYNRQKKQKEKQASEEKAKAEQLKKEQEEAEKKAKLEAEQQAQKAEAERLERERKEKEQKEKNNNSSDNSNASSGHHCQTCHKELTNLDYKLNPNYCETCEKNNNKRKNEESHEESSKKQKTENDASNTKEIENNQSESPKSQNTETSQQEINSAEKCRQCGQKLANVDIKLNQDNCFACRQKEMEKRQEEWNEKQKKWEEDDEFSRLDESLFSHKLKDLATLEKNYQIVKNSLLYTVNKKNFSDTKYGSNNKERLDNSYYTRKRQLQPLEKQKNNQTNQSTKDLDEKLKRTTKNNNSNINENEIKQYLQENNICLITLKDNGELLIEYNDQRKPTTTIANGQQLREIKSYLQSKDKKTISKVELETKQNQPSKTNFLLWVMGGGALFLMGIIVYLLIRKHKKK